MKETQQQSNPQDVSSIVEVPPHVLKDGDCFAIIDRRGNIRPLGVENHGLYRDDTRFLARFMIKVAGEIPLLLSSSMSDDADFLSVDLTNARIDAVQTVFQDTVHFRQKVVLRGTTLFVSFTVHNYGAETVKLPLTLEFDADFADIFQVRGLKRQVRGQTLPAEVETETVTLRYVGLDELERQTHLVFSPQPSTLDSTRAGYELCIGARQEESVNLAIECRYAHEIIPEHKIKAPFEHVTDHRDERTSNICHTETSNKHFNEWIKASYRDLMLLLTEKGGHLYPYAGVPWFSTVFGRDGIITALQTLWLYPDIARGVLVILASKQATTEDLAHESEPGKILHEERRSEMANTGEVPFSSYYGTVDATPLFVVLAGQYYRRTGDRALIQELWPSIEAALYWIDHYGDIDGDGFVEYRRKNEKGILQQGWKDSNDSVFYEDGHLVNPPVALCEVQGYVYEAKTLAAEIAEAIGKSDLARQLRQQADDLRDKFQQAFWLDDLGTYAIALDGDKRPCHVRTSNAGHSLYSGIADPRHAELITEQLLGPDFFSGWGIRTLASSETRYNPMAYHNGTVWPHDNSLIVAGMANYGFKTAAKRVIDALFEASTYLDLYRLPELFCGFEKRHREGPTLYPVACLPQAWAAASIYLMLQACLGIQVDGLKKQIIFQNPVLPLDLDSVIIRELPIGDLHIDLTVYRENGEIKIRSQGDNIDIIVIL